MSVWLLIMMTVTVGVNGYGLLAWLGWNDPDRPNLTYSGVPLPQIPFEELSPEDRFLVEASKIAGLSLDNLDTCEHKLVMRLKASCGSLSDEQLAKFSVNLLNCHLAVEGRTEYPCSEDMSLKDCTKEMDPETWNSYHIISNRARAVCYASRQQQFRALSELTVNKLIETAHSHIQALTDLQKEHSHLKEGTSVTLKEVERTQMSVLARQRNLVSLSLAVSREHQATLDSKKQEAKLIDDYRTALSSLFTHLQNNLDAAGKLVSANSGLTKKGHEDLIKGHKETAENINIILGKLGESSEGLLQRNEKVLNSVREISEELGRVMSVVGTFRGHTAPLMDWINTDEKQVDMAVRSLCHAVGLACAMLLCSFVSAPFTSRVVLLLAAPINAWASLSSHQYPHLTLPVFYLSFGIATICDCVIRLVLGEWMRRDKRPPSPAGAAPATATLPRQNYTSTPATSRVPDWLSESHLQQSRNFFPNSNGFLKRNRFNFDNSTFKEEEDEDDGRVSVASSVRRSSRRTTPARSVDGGDRTICVGISKSSGLRCRKFAMTGSVYCHTHGR